MSKNKKYQILPLGFAVLVVLLVLLFALINVFIRLNSAPNKLLYIINKEIDSTENTFLASFSVITDGDIVESTPINYIIKSSIELNSNITLINTSLNVDGVTLPEFSTEIIGSNIKFKLSNSNEWKILNANIFNEILVENPQIIKYINMLGYNVNNLDNIISSKFALSEFISILDMNDPKLLAILKSNLISVKSNLNNLVDFGENKNEFILTFTLNEYYELIESIILNLTKHKDFEKTVVTRVSKLNSLYNDSSINKFIELKTLYEYSNIINWKMNFKDTLMKCFYSSKKHTLSKFKDSSVISIKIKTKKLQILNINIKTNFEYKFSEGFEKWNLVLTK